MSIEIHRAWAMPNMHTFQIKPIKRLIYRYLGEMGGGNWIDPFAGENSPAEYTNDLNPNKPTKYHMTAEAFGNTIRMMVDKRITFKQLNAPAL